MVGGPLCVRGDEAESTLPVGEEKDGARGVEVNVKGIHPSPSCPVPMGLRALL
jgi:hypothetical protein